VLEGKLDQMKVLEPKVNNAIAKLNAINSVPSPAVVKATEAETKTMMKQIDSSTDGRANIAKVNAASTAQEKGKVGSQEEPEIESAPKV